MVQESLSLLQLIVLAIVQGLTEFLPISSSGHLILPGALLGWSDQGLAFDVAVHVGTLLAVLVYFRRDLAQLALAWGRDTMHRRVTAESRPAWFLVVGTIPAGLAGLLMDDLVESHLRTVVVIASTTILFGVLLGLADRCSSRARGLDTMGWRDAVMIGLAQALALVPGTSRSGITMTAGLMLGFDRMAAARFSFLLSIPVIVLSGAYKGLALMQGEAVDWGALSIAVVVSALTAYACIRTFLTWVERVGMMPFVWYRLLLGILLLILYSREAL